MKPPDEHAASPWRFLERTYVLRSPWRNFVVERVETQPRVEMAYHYMEAPHAVFVVPLTAEGRSCSSGSTACPSMTGSGRSRRQYR